MAGQQRGKITTWKDDKGFGFITPDTRDKDVFFHIKNVANRSTRPTEQMTVYYTLAYDEQQRPRAIQVYLDNGSITPIVLTLAIISVFFALLGAAALQELLPSWTLLVYVLVSGATYALYRDDKMRAGREMRRIPEQTLHMFELCGGWPGALVAQWYFRHKNRKRSYQITFWFMAIVNIIILALLSFIYVMALQSFR